MQGSEVHAPGKVKVADSEFSYDTGRRSISELDLSRGRRESSEVWGQPGRGGPRIPNFPKGTRNRLAGNPPRCIYTGSEKHTAAVQITNTVPEQNVRRQMDWILQILASIRFGLATRSICWTPVLREAPAEQPLQPLRKA